MFLSWALLDLASWPSWPGGKASAFPVEDWSLPAGDTAVSGAGTAAARSLPAIVVCPSLASPNRSRETEQLFLCNQ